jgi:hypothetical protein
MTPRRFFLLSLASIAPFFTIASAAAAPKKKTAVKKAYDYEQSKYKSREPSQTPTYKFNEKGEPIAAGANKKKLAKTKKRSEPPEAEEKGLPGACGAQDSCGESKTEADGL